MNEIPVYLNLRPTAEGYYIYIGRYSKSKELVHVIKRVFEGYEYFCVPAWANHAVDRVEGYWSLPITFTSPDIG